jgi:ABC-type multidrug transport system ATPase subunit
LILQQIRKEFAKPTSISSAFANFGKKNNSVLPLNNKKIAVRNLSIGFKTGEIFGLLGE